MFLMCAKNYVSRMIKLESDKFCCTDDHGQLASNHQLLPSAHRVTQCSACALCVQVAPLIQWQQGAKLLGANTLMQPRPTCLSRSVTTPSPLTVVPPASCAGPGPPRLAPGSKAGSAAPSTQTSNAAEGFTVTCDEAVVVVWTPVTLLCR